MMPLSLPEEDRRGVVRSFWFLLSAIFAIAASAVASLGLSLAWVGGLIAFGVIASLVFINERLVRKLYHAWNNRIIRPMSDLVSTIILRICHLIIFAAVGRTGTRLPIEPDRSRTWMPREFDRNHTGLLPFVSLRNAAAGPKGWMRTYARWAADTGNGWALFLLPFFCMLRLVSREEPKAAGANIYTLF
jgi:hypothetical protein